MNSIPTQGKIPRSETPLDPKKARPVHGFLLCTRKLTYHPAQIMIDVRDFLDDLYELSATFKLGEVCEGMQYTPASIKDKMLVMAGAWRASDVFVNSSGTQANSWINPHHVHKVRYSDALTRCDCGKIMVREKTAGDRASALPHDGVDEHTDDCTLQQKYDARSRLLANRARIIEQMLRLGHDGTDCYPRLGLNDQGTISHLVERIGVNVQECKADFKERRANTLAELLPLFTTEEAGRVYGISSTTVRGILRENHDIDLRSMKEVREKNRRRIDGMYGDLKKNERRGKRPTRVVVSDD